MVFDKKKMVKVLKSTTSYYLKRVRRNNQLLLCEASKHSIRQRPWQAVSVAVWIEDSNWFAIW